ncbi:MAG: PAS domain-containing protein [Hyphomicrobium sp.]
MSLTLDIDAPFYDSVLSRMNGFLYRCRADKDFTMLELTSGFERCSGFGASDVIGNRVRSFASLIHPEDLASVDNAVVKGLEQRKNWNINYRFQHTSGRFIWVHEDGGGVWDGSDTLAFLEGAVFDIQHLYASLMTQFSAPGQA